ncbi:MAG: radical SAM protein [Clostridia bacterium]|nr:radical SAM protein [Clostridia bacterium]
MGCMLCPRHCGAERETRPGFCGLGRDMVIGRIAPHLWEEPPISGSRGTGAVFFSGCTLRCVYCQNAEISHRNAGRIYSPRELADAFRRLEAMGMQSISLITGTPFIPRILEALEIYRPRLPLVWNSSGYEAPEALRLLDGVIDVYLPDLKHYSPRMGKRCAGAPDYFQQASAAIREMCRQTGRPLYGPEGIMTRGTLVRHLILPGLTGESMKLLTWIRDTLPEGTPVSLMHQYVPMNGVSVPGLDRKVTRQEYQRVLEHMIALDLPGFLQEEAAAREDFIPAFNEEESFI